MKNIYIFVLALSLSQFAHSELTGSLRDSFVRTARNTCFANQRQAGVNSSISDTTLKQYCQCNSEYLANILNNQLAIEIENGNVPISPSWINLAATYCQKQFSNYKPF